jgi:glycosyltransferase involved in cell wall biosynthesis
VSGHLRREKDPFAVLRALQQLPAAPIQVQHCGGEIESGYGAQARQWQQREMRYHYLGELSRQQAAMQLCAADLLINASLQEGCPAIVVEAIVAGVAVLASDIPAHRALLGQDYAGLFAATDDQALAALLQRAYRDASFLPQLRQALKQQAPRFSPAHEAQTLLTLVHPLIQHSKQGKVDEHND